MCTPVKHALVDHPETSKRVALKVGRSEGWMSKVSRGMITPNEIDKKKLANVLGKSIEELFPQEPVGSI